MSMPWKTKAKKIARVKRDMTKKPFLSTNPQIRKKIAIKFILENRQNLNMDPILIIIEYWVWLIYYSYVRVSLFLIGTH